MRFLIVQFLILTIFVSVSGQNATVYGTILNEEGEPIESASISVPYTSNGTTSDQKGYYELEIPANKKVDIHMRFIGYYDFDTTLILKQGQRYKMDIRLAVNVKEIQEVFKYGSINKGTNLTRIDIRDFGDLPSASGNIESLLKTYGASSNNELSSQYSVRGGNFDENLVYVNDVQIYRPFLVRSGQQEGLSFINPDMVRSIEFSAGGFEPRFGDKMSSVLDIKYRVPTERAGSVSLSLLGGSVSLEGTAFRDRFSYINGFRYKTTRYMLNTLDVSGNYKPSFYDFQTYLNYRVNNKLNFSFLGNYSLNNYLLQPETRLTEFGTFNQAMNVMIYYFGQEVDNFLSFTGAITTSWEVNDHSTIKLIASSFNTSEKETYDIIGYYQVSDIDVTSESSSGGDSLIIESIAGFHNHARNYLDAQVYAITLNGAHEKGRNNTMWGVNMQSERIEDEINEWQIIDSADYFIPYYEYNVSIYHRVKADNNLKTFRYNAYVQHTKFFETKNSECYLTFGSRIGYWDYNKQILISPRTSIAIIPKENLNLSYFGSIGYYYQPPFYKEFRDENGILNNNIIAQKSVHFIVGTDLLFSAWQRPFKFKTEVFYKYLDNLVPYKVENVRIQYEGRNLSHGYASGIEFKLSGEFVKEAQSWASLTFMSTKEDIPGDFYFKDHKKVYPGYIRRPTDQIMNFAMFFQDYFPNNPEYKFHLSFFFGTRLPMTNPFDEEYYKIYTMKSYKRVDVGFSKSLKILSGIGVFKNAWVNLELLNAFGFDNVSSYTWIRTVESLQGNAGQYAVPNYLTGRRVNGKITLKF